MRNVRGGKETEIAKAQEIAPTAARAGEKVVAGRENGEKNGRATETRPEASE